MLQVHHQPAHVAAVQVARHGEQPGPEPRIVGEVGRVPGQAQPGLLQQILGQLPLLGQPRQEGKEPWPVQLVDPVERRGVPAPEPLHQRLFLLPLHVGINAPGHAP